MVCQRREYFRIGAPLYPPYYGVTTLPDTRTLRFRLFDLSLGGMGALLESAIPDGLIEGARFSQVELNMGPWGIFHVDAQLIAISERKVIDGKNETITTPRQSFRFLNVSPAVERELPVLTRSTKNVEKWDSLLPLPESYVVPGGRFREIYYWDSYFTMLGLAESGHWDKVADMVANFGYEIDAWGHIPNGNRTYYLSRSQPPFFAFMVELLAQHEGDDALKEYLPQLQKEYTYWMEGVETLQPGQQNQRVVKLEDGSVLNRYWDDRDTPRPESWVEDIATAKSNPNRPATEI